MKKNYAIESTNEDSGTSCSVYDLTTVNCKDRFATTSEDRFENSTIRRMSMRSSVFEKRKPCIIMFTVYLINLIVNSFSNNITIMRIHNLGTRMNLAKPQITSVISEMHATIGEQVTLRLSFSGTPQPTVAWTFKERPLVDSSVELSADGSLVIVCVELSHTGRSVMPYMKSISSNNNNV